MRIVKEIQHSDCKISVYSWNDKYLIKFEKGQLEQTYKISEWDIFGDESIDNIVSQEFIEKVMTRFDDMIIDFNQAIANI